MKKLPPLVLPLLLLACALLLPGKFPSESRVVAHPAAAPELARMPDLGPVAAGKAVVASFWRFEKQAEGDPAGLAPAAAAASRGRDLLPAGRRTRIDTFPDLRLLKEGEKVDVALPDGRIFAGTVNWSRRDEGYENTHQVSIGFAGNQGGLVATHDGTNGRSQGRLLIEHDRLAWTLETGENGTLWLVERLREDLVCALPDASEAARSAPLPGDPGVPGGGSIAPVLSSKADAAAVLYIDFDGQPTQTYPDWPSSNPGGVAIAVPHSGLTADQMTLVWRRVAEDFIQFNLNVTTDAAKYTAATVGSRMRMLVGLTLPAGVNGAGLAFVRSFRSNASTGFSFSSTVPCWLAVSPSYGNPATMTTGQFSSLASNTAHEFGHTLGLWHDGNDGWQPSDGAGGNYYPGHGTSPFDWGSIMGNPYRSGSTAKGVLQWAKNEYPGANNSQDDLAILAGGDNGFGYRSDESSARGNAIALGSTATNQVGGAGIVANAGDLDWWSFQVPRAGNVTITVAPADTGVSLPNLDCGFRIENAAGDIVAGGFGPQDNLTAGSVVNLTTGIYHVVAYGTGNRQFSNSTGYDAYGSTGRYLVTVSLPPDSSAPLAAVVSPAPGSVLTSPNLLFSGTASDDDRVSSLSIFLRRNNDGKWWNGSVWQVAQSGLSQSYDSGTGVWTCTAPLPPVGGNSPEALGAGTYSFIVIAEDPALNLTQADAGVTVDTGAPITQISGPVNGSVITASSYPFDGTVTDSGSVDRVVLFIRRLADNLFWDGSTWIAGPQSANLSSVYNATTGTWTCNDTLPVPGNSLGNGSYHFIAIGYDLLGNTHQTDSFVAVDFHQVYQWTAGSFTDQIPDNNDFYWGNPANWSPNGIPSPQDIVYIDLAHTVRSTVSRTVYGFNMSTGALDFDNDAHALTVTKSGSWTGGTLLDSVFIESSASFQLSGNGVKQIGGGSVIHNSGTVTWTGPGTLQGDSNSIWNNKSGSSFTLLTDGDVLSLLSSGNVFNNEAGASFVKSGGSGECCIAGWTFNNNGTIQAQQGTLHFDTTLNLGAGSTFAGEGRILLNGTTNLAAALTSTGNPELIGNLNATAASFSGTNPLIWSSGVIDGNFSLLAGSVLDLTTAATKQIGGAATVNNFGRIHWKAGLLQGYSDSTFNNESGGIFDAVSDGDIFSLHSSGSVFNNKAGALFIKSGKSAVADGESLVDEWTFNNRGVIRSDTGTLRFHLPLNLLGGGSIVRNGALAAKVRSSSDFVLTGTTTVSDITFEAAGDWHGNLDAGTSGDGTIATQSGGVFEWTAGTAHNTVNIAAGSTFAISGPDLKQIGDGGVLNNGGIATRTGAGELRGYSNSSFVNLPGAVFNVETNAPFTNFQSGNRLVNHGALHLAGTSPLHWSFTQTATGRLNLDIAGPADFDRLQVSGDAVLAGRIAVALVNGYAPVPDTAFPVLTFGSRSGAVTATTGSGSIWGMQHHANNLTLVAKTHPTVWSEWAGYHFQDLDSADAQLAADPDLDGLANLLEYALGRDPHAGGSAATFAGTLDLAGETYLSLRFTRPAGSAALTDVNYAGERSTALADWSAAGVVQHSVVPVPGELRETVTLRSTQPIGGADSGFLHLKVGVGN